MYNSSSRLLSVRYHTTYIGDPPIRVVAYAPRDTQPTVRRTKKSAFFKAKKPPFLRRKIRFSKNEPSRFCQSEPIRFSKSEKIRFSQSEQSAFFKALHRQSFRVLWIRCRCKSSLRIPASSLCWIVVRVSRISLYFASLHQHCDCNVSYRSEKSRKRIVVAFVAPLAPCSSRPLPSPRSLIRSARERVFSVRYR